MKVVGADSVDVILDVVQCAQIGVVAFATVFVDVIDDLLLCVAAVVTGNPHRCRRQCEKHDQSAADQSQPSWHRALLPNEAVQQSTGSRPSFRRNSLVTVRIGSAGSLALGGAAG